MGHPALVDIGGLFWGVLKSIKLLSFYYLMALLEGEENVKNLQNKTYIIILLFNYNSSKYKTVKRKATTVAWDHINRNSTIG